MYVYNTRIWQRYGRPAVSLALLVDEDPQFRPDQFVREKGGCRLTFTFPVVKLLGYKSEEELEADPSPLAVASLVQLGKLRAGSDMGRRLAIKLALARALYVREYGRERLLKLFRFLDYVLTLPEELSREFDRELEDIEETLNMPYVTGIERRRRRRQEGRQEAPGRAPGGNSAGSAGGDAPGRAGLVTADIAGAVRHAARVVAAEDRALPGRGDAGALHQQALTVPSIDELQF